MENDFEWVKMKEKTINAVLYCLPNYIRIYKLVNIKTLPSICANTIVYEQILHQYNGQTQHQNLEHSVRITFCSQCNQSKVPAAQQVMGALHCARLRSVVQACFPLYNDVV